MLYKLIVLYMLDTVNFPLTKSQVFDFMLGKDYTHFLTLQRVFSELEEADMISSKTMANRTYLSITDDGKSTLTFFQNRISAEIKADVKSYVNENKWDMKNEVNITSQYYKTTKNDYTAHLVAKERGVPMVDLKLNVPTKEMAATICDNWQEKNQEIYQYLTQQLF